MSRLVLSRPVTTHPAATNPKSLLLAEKERFELSVDLHPRRFSKPCPPSNDVAERSPLNPQDQAEKPAWSRGWNFLVEVRVAIANATLVDRMRHGVTVGV
ncbi:MAG: hypothetical protein IPG50_32565 [Myxococcales bacterium]|nr:hypothetical protein [Myxococcales bacterium]